MGSRVTSSKGEGDVKYSYLRSVHHSVCVSPIDLLVTGWNALSFGSDFLRDLEVTCHLRFLTFPLTSINIRRQPAFLCTREYKRGWHL